MVISPARVHRPHRDCYTQWRPRRWQAVLLGTVVYGLEPLAEFAQLAISS